MAPPTASEISRRDRFVCTARITKATSAATVSAKKSCIVFFDEVDAIGGARSSGDGDGGSDNEVQRTMLQIVTELDGFDPRGNIKVLMATNRPDTLDPALLRPGRFDRHVYVPPPDAPSRVAILEIALRKTPHTLPREHVEALGRRRTAGFSGAELVALVREVCVATRSFNQPSSRFHIL